MEIKKVAAAKAGIQRFLATIYAYEISPRLYQEVKSEDFFLLQRNNQTQNHYFESDSNER